MNQSSLTANADVYSYSMEIVLETIVKIFVFGITGYYLGIFWPLLWTLIAFVFLRVAIGGSHMSSFGGCLIVSLLVIIGMTKIAIYPAWHEFAEPVFWTTLILGFFVIKLPSLKIIKYGIPMKEKGLKLKPALILLLLWALMVCVFMILGSSLYADCLIIGACGGFIFTTSLGSKVIGILDRWNLNMRGGKNE